MRSGVYWYYLDPASGVMVTGAGLQVGSHLSTPTEPRQWCDGHWVAEGSGWYLQPGSGRMVLGG